MQTFSDLVRERLSELRLNAFSAENSAGLPPDAIRNVLRSQKQAGPTLARAKEICDALGLEIRIEPKSKQPDWLRQSNSDPEAIPLPGFLPIPWIESGHQSGSAPVAFSRLWLERHQLVPDFLLAARPDTVELDQPAADTVALINTRDARREGTGLWCFRDAGRVQVAHLTFHGDLTVVHPARPDSPARIFAKPADGPTRLFGRVVWLGQSLPVRGSVK